MANHKEIEFVKLMVQIRNTYNLTQSDLAKKLDVSRSTIAKIESFENKPTTKLVQNFINEFRSEIEKFGFNRIYLISNDGIAFKTIFQTIKSNIKNFFEETDDYGSGGVQSSFEDLNATFKNNMDRLIFLERENELLKAKIETQEEFINKLINKESIKNK